MISVDRAIVLYLDRDSDPAGGQVRGRAEHVLSGKAGRFASLPELLALLGRLLGDRAEETEPTS